MNKQTFKYIASLFAVVAIIAAVTGIIHHLNPCWWPFGNNDQSVADQLIAEYRLMENDFDYDKTLFKKIGKIVNCDRKSNITLHLIYLRLKYFKAIDGNNQSAVNNVADEAADLLKGTHAIYTKESFTKKTKIFLTAIKNSKRTVKLQYHKGVFLLCCIIMAFIFAGGSLSGGTDLSTLIAAILIGGVAGGLLYKFLLIYIWHAPIPFNYEIPLVPIG